jgi:chromosome partitioning protein
MPYVIAICHQKGGVAKTTTALALGACLVEQHCETLLIDLDPQANLTAGMALDPAQLRRSAADILLGNETLLQMSRETGVPGLDIVPSNADMTAAAQFLHVRTGYEYLLRDTLARPDVAQYEVVLIDCPPSLGPITINALTAAHLALIPTQCEYFSMQALDSVFKLICLVRTRTNPDLIYRLLITMFDRRGHLHSRAFAHLQQHLGASLLQTIIGFDSRLRESQLVGLPITQHAGRSRGTQQYRQLAEELLTYVRRHILSAA